MISSFVLGVTSYFTAFRLIREYNLWNYVYISGIISLSVGGLIVGASYALSGVFGSMLTAVYPFEWGAVYFAKIASVASAIGLISLSYFAYKYIILAILSPLMGPLSETLESNIVGVRSNQSSVGVLLKGLVRGIRVSLRNISREIFYTIILLILGLVPGFAIITAPMLFLIQAYYVGFANMDYYSERHYTVRQSARFVKLNQFYALGNGSVFLLMITIPFIGLFFAPCLATVAATHSILTSKSIVEPA